MAALRLIRHMDTPAVREAFQDRIESPRMLYYFPHGEPLIDLGDWQHIPAEYRARLLGFVTRRPVDEGQSKANVPTDRRAAQLP
ncbi:MAG: hypothetical protein H8E44_47455 [Planctomycetes bacterium]|nr:hypothetical protein [Planctomycetota bacterium]